MEAAAKGEILVVDDDPQVRQMLALVLRLQGWEVGQAADGEEALLRMQAAVPDVLLLDQRMPGLLGTELHQRLRQAGFRVPTILITAAVDGKDQAAAAGIEHYLEKPINLAALEELLNQLMRQSAEAGAGRALP